MAETQRKQISLEALVEMFENIESQTLWDMSEDMLWGYFFAHETPKKLEQAASVLSNAGYRVVDVYLSEKEETSDPGLYWLHVERVETQTPQSLHERNDELYLFASEFGIDRYDGMDVGPAPQ